MQILSVNTGSAITGTIRQAGLQYSLTSSIYSGSSAAGNYLWRSVVIPELHGVTYVTSTHTQSLSTYGSSIPLYYTASLSNADIISKANGLPDRYNQTPFTTTQSAFDWTVKSGKYFLMNYEYPPIVSEKLTLLWDSALLASYPQTGSTFYDLSSTNAVGTLNGPTYVNNGVIGSTYFSFIGNDFIYANNNQLGLNTKTEGTIEFTVKVSYNGSYQQVGGFRDDTDFDFFLLILPNNNTEFRIRNSVGYLDVNVNFGSYYEKWSQITCVHDNGTSILYANGGKIGTADAGQSGKFGTTSNNFTVGMHPNQTNYPLTGSVASVKVYSKALSSDEVMNNFRYGNRYLFSDCKTANDIITLYPQLEGYDGYYYVFPDGPLGNPVKVHCDMTTDGGGWMLVARSHPSTITYNGQNWGWKGGAIGNLEDFSQAYQAGWYSKWHSSSTFSSFIFGNRGNFRDNTWGYFIYKVSGINYSTFFTSDTQQGYTNSTVKSDTNVYGTTSYPGMQGAVGFTTTGTNNNLYYMRDCCGFAGYGGYPTYMSTTYCGANFYYAGPWCGGATTDSLGNFEANSYTSNGLLYGGTNQYMIMVR